MRSVPQPDGGCHDPNYWDIKLSQILSAQINSAEAVAMEPKITGSAMILPATGLVEPVATWALLRRVALLLQNHLHPQPLCLVGEHLPELSRRHLVDFLVCHLVVLGRPPYIPDVANHNRLHASCVERGDKPGCLFVQNLCNQFP